MGKKTTKCVAFASIPSSVRTAAVEFALEALYLVDAAQTAGVVPNVVFPTGVDDRGEGRVDVYYGMADLRIGAARLQVPDELPAETA